MRLLPTLLGLTAIAHGQYFAPQDEISSTSASSSGIDCFALADGNYAGGCFSKYISCVAGIPYSIDCPSNLLFDDVQNKCVYPHECGIPATTPAFDTTTVTISTPSTAAPSTIVCSQLKDGFYSEGCTEHYTVCTFGVSATAWCPSGLVYDMSTQNCEYPERCGQIGTTQPTSDSSVQYPIPTTTEKSISTTDANDSPFDCQNKEDSDYALDCSNDYISCFSGMAISRRCPLGLFFSDSNKRCQLACDLDSTTIDQDTTSSPEPTNMDTTTVSARTSAPVTSPSVSGRCINGEVTSQSNCSSEFRRCRCEQWISAVCPGPSVFDELSGLCLYSLPRCHTDFVPTEASPVYYPAVGTGYETSQTNHAASNVYLPHWEHDQLLVSNPFFTHKKRYRHGKKHGHTDKVRKMGKLRAASKSVRIDDRISYVTDAFRGPYEPYVHSSSWSVFPRNRVHRMRMRQTDDDFSSDETPDDEEEVTTTTAQPSTESPTLTPPVTALPFAIGPSGPLVATSNEVEGSGEDVTEEGVTRQKRSYGNAGRADNSNDIHRFCRGVASSTLISFGVCRRDFIFCRSYVAHLAGCPVGDLYDDTKNSCVPANICGVADSEICGTIPAVSTPPMTDVPATPSSGASISTCTEGFSGILTPLNCSSTYTVCDNGIEIAMSCPDGLFYNANGRCDYSNATSLCGQVTVSQDSPPSSTTPTAENPTPVPYLPMQTTPGAASVAPYVPTISTSSIPPVLSGECGGTNTGFVAAAPCAPMFLVCSDGKVLTRMNCPANLVFNKAGGYCDFASAVSECSDFLSTVTTPRASIVPEVQDIVTTVRPITTTVFEQSVTGPCSGMTDGYIPTERCSNRYVSCIGGRVTATMYCSAGLVFNGNLIACVRPEDLKECSDSVVVPISTVGFPSTTATTTTVATTPAHLRPTMQYTEPVSGVTEVSCSAPVSSAEVCSPVYTLCSNGVDYELTCPSPLVFNKDSKACTLKKFVAECVESVPVTTSTIAAIASTTLGEHALPLESTTFGYDGVTEGTTYTLPVESSTFGYEAVTEVTTSVPLPSSTQRKCAFEENAPGISLGFCSNQYDVCQADETLKTLTCDIGRLFDTVSSKCVPAAECGRPVMVEATVTTTTTSTPDIRCSKLPSGSGYAAETPCSNSYLSCHQGVATTKHCPDKFMYSETRGLCMRRQHVRECKNTYGTASSDHSSFCMGREDNLYRDPQDCAGIIQCHGYELFKHSGCPSGLWFNDETKGCDYRHNVKGCEEKQQHPQNDSSCNGNAHGAYIPSDSDCTVFYRCVWDSLVRMKCPFGTVFNPMLNVCDYPSAVPHCSAATPVRPY